MGKKSVKIGKNNEFMDLSSLVKIAFRGFNNEDSQFGGSKRNKEGVL